MAKPKAPYPNPPPSLGEGASPRERVGAAAKKAAAPRRQRKRTLQQQARLVARAFRPDPTS